MGRTFPTVLSEVLIGLLIGIFMMFAIAAVVMHKQTTSRPDAPITEAGAIQVLVLWDDKSCADIDTWFLAPGDHAIGYSDKNGRVADLLRDDLGCINDRSGKNFEIVQTHGAPAGEYVVNVVYYATHGEMTPQKIHVIGQLRPHPNDSMVDLFDETVTLDHACQEITVIRFTLDKNGRVVMKNRLPMHVAPDSVIAESCMTSGVTGPANGGLN